MTKSKVKAIDMFCGAGGSSWGAKSAGIEIVAAFDMWPVAELVYKDNFPGTRFYCDKLENIDPFQLTKEIGQIDLILASPECTNHSVAKGNKPRCEKSKETALQVIRFAKAFKPRWIVIENVVSMKNWQRYKEFIEELQKLGYNILPQTINSENFGVPQSRRRMFILCDLEKKPQPIQIPKRNVKTARNIIDGNGTYNYSPLITKRRAQATIERAERAMENIGYKKPFLIVYYGTDHAGGWQNLDVPLRTITTIDRFAFIKPTKDGHIMRMLQPEELKLAMGWPKSYKFNNGTRRDKIKMIGNAVCPPVMKTIVNRLTITK